MGDDGDWAMHDFGSAIGFCLDIAGFLELERCLIGDGKAGAASQNIKSIVPIERLHQARPVAPDGLGQSLRQRFDGIQ